MIGRTPLPGTTIATMRWLAPVGLLLATLAAGLIVLPGSTSPIRPLVAVVFLATCPGLSLVRLLRLRSAALECLLGVSLSLTLAMLVAEALLYTGLWSATTALLILMSLTVVGASVDLEWPEIRPKRPNFFPTDCA